MKRGEDIQAIMVERDKLEFIAGMSFDDAFARFIAETQKMLDAHHASRPGLPGAWGAVLEIDMGSRYIRVWNRGTHNGQPDGSRSAYFFVDKLTGDILKSATWRSPAKGSRGNIFQDSRHVALSPYGVRYL